MKIKKSQSEITDRQASADQARTLRRAKSVGTDLAFFGGPTGIMEVNTKRRTLFPKVEDLSKNLKSLTQPLRTVEKRTLGKSKSVGTDLAFFGGPTGIVEVNNERRKIFSKIPEAQTNSSFLQSLAAQPSKRSTTNLGAPANQKKKNNPRKSVSM